MSSSVFIIIFRSFKFKNENKLVPSYFKVRRCVSLLQRFVLKYLLSDPRNKAHKFSCLISFRFFFEAFFSRNIALLLLLYKTFWTQKLIVYKLFLKIVNPSGINHLHFCFDWFVKWKPYKHIRKYICCAISYKFFWFIFKSL